MSEGFILHTSDGTFGLTEQDVDASDLDIIVDALGKAQVAVELEQERAGKWAWYLQRRMEAIGASESVSDDFEATFKSPGIDYDQVDLLPVLEAEGLTVEELEDAGAVVLAHIPEPQEVPTRFNLTKLKVFAKRSAHIQAIIDSAATPRPPKLKIKARCY